MDIGKFVTHHTYLISFLNLDIVCVGLIVTHSLILESLANTAVICLCSKSDLFQILMEVLQRRFIETLCHGTVES